MGNDSVEKLETVSIKLTSLIAGMEARTSTAYIDTTNNPQKTVKNVLDVLNGLQDELLALKNQPGKEQALDAHLYGNFIAAQESIKACYQNLEDVGTDNEMSQIQTKTFLSQAQDSLNLFKAQFIATNRRKEVVYAFPTAKDDENVNESLATLTETIESIFKPKFSTLQSSVDAAQKAITAVETYLNERKDNSPSAAVEKYEINRLDFTLDFLKKTMTFCDAKRKGNEEELSTEEYKLAGECVNEWIFDHMLENEKLSENSDLEIELVREGISDTVAHILLETYTDKNKVKRATPTYEDYQNIEESLKTLTETIEHMFDNTRTLESSVNAAQRAITAVETYLNERKKNSPSPAVGKYEIFPLNDLLELLQTIMTVCNDKRQSNEENQPTEEYRLAGEDVDIWMAVHDIQNEKLSENSDLEKELVREGISETVKDIISKTYRGWCADLSQVAVEPRKPRI